MVRQRSRSNSTLSPLDENNFLLTRPLIGDEPVEVDRRRDLHAAVVPKIPGQVLGHSLLPFPSEVAHEPTRHVVDAHRHIRLVRQRVIDPHVARARGTALPSCIIYSNP